MVLWVHSSITVLGLLSISQFGTFCWLVHRVHMQLLVLYNPLMYLFSHVLYQSFLAFAFAHLNLHFRSAFFYLSCWRLLLTLVWAWALRILPVTPGMCLSIPLILWETSFTSRSLSWLSTFCGDACEQRKRADLGCAVPAQPWYLGWRLEGKMGALGWFWCIILSFHLFSSLHYIRSMLCGGRLRESPWGTRCCNACVDDVPAKRRQQNWLRFISTRRVLNVFHQVLLKVRVGIRIS